MIFRPQFGQRLYYKKIYIKIYLYAKWQINQLVFKKITNNSSIINRSKIRDTHASNKKYNLNNGISD